LAIFFAQYSPSIIDGLLILYSVWAPTMLIPLFAALFGWRTTPAAGVLAILAGGTASVVWQTALHEPNGIPAILIGLTAAAIGFALGLAIGSPLNVKPPVETA
jgi:SSS family solute:Na+ symporter